MLSTCRAILRRLGLVGSECLRHGAILNLLIDTEQSPQQDSPISPIGSDLRFEVTPHHSEDVKTVANNGHWKHGLGWQL